MCRLRGASGIHVGTMGYGKMEGEGDDKSIAYMIERDECPGPVYVINTAGGGSHGHIDSPAAGTISLRQAYECWKVGADPLDWAKMHREFARAFESFPGWRNKLGVKAA